MVFENIRLFLITIDIGLKESSVLVIFHICREVCHSLSLANYLSNDKTLREQLKALGFNFFNIFKFNNITPFRNE